MVVVASALVSTALATATTNSTVGAIGAPDSDFDGDGYADLVLAVPGEDFGRKIDAGALTVVYGSRNGADPRRSQTISQAGKVKGANESGDQFGRAFDTGDINGDGRSDLVVGAPNEAVGSVEAAGSVTVLYGSAAGLRKTGTQVFTQGGAVDGTVETGDRFGAAVALGDFNGDGHDDVAVGSPHEDDGSVVDAGAVTILYGAASGLTTAANATFTQGNGVAGSSGTGDRFASSLAAGDFDGDGRDDLAVGVPGENAEAGAVIVLYGSSSGITPAASRTFSQAGEVGGSPQSGDGFGTAVAAGDFDGDGRDDLAAGVPGEDVSGKVDAGQVNVLRGSSSGLRTGANRVFSQAGSVNGSVEAGDRFGASLAVGDFDRNRRDDLAVGVTGEDVGARRNAGQVNVLYGSAKGLAAAGDFDFTQGNGVKGSAESHDRLGSSVLAADLNGDGRDDVIAGAPGEDLPSATDAGTVNVLYGSRRGIRKTGNAVVGQSGRVAGIAERGDGLGLPAYETWIDRVNLYRRQAGLDPVTESARLSADAELHARYMVRNGVVSHSEISSKPGYTSAGNASGGRSNVYGTTLWSTTDKQAVDGWITGPFHAVGFLTPNLIEVGYGSYRDSDAAYIKMAAGLDVWGAERKWSKTPSRAYAWPGDGAVVPVRAHINEWPSPTSHCPGHGGLPVIAFFVESVNVSKTTFSVNGTPLDHCVFDGTNYDNPDIGAQSLGRSILRNANAVVVMPRNGLWPGQEYCFSVTSRGEQTSSCFTIDPNA